MLTQVCEGKGAEEPRVADEEFKKGTIPLRSEETNHPPALPEEPGTGGGEDGGPPEDGKKLPDYPTDAIDQPTGAGGLPVQPGTPPPPKPSILRSLRSAIRPVRRGRQPGPRRAAPEDCAAAPAAPPQRERESPMEQSRGGRGCWGGDSPLIWEAPPDRPWPGGPVLDEQSRYRRRSCPLNWARVRHDRG
jgi:hypothetical protein